MIYFEICPGYAPSPEPHAPPKRPFPPSMLRETQCYLPFRRPCQPKEQKSEMEIETQAYVMGGRPVDSSVSASVMRIAAPATPYVVIIIVQRVLVVCVRVYLQFRFHPPSPLSMYSTLSCSYRPPLFLYHCRLPPRHILPQFQI